MLTYDAAYDAAAISEVTSPSKAVTSELAAYEEVAAIRKSYFTI